MKKIKCLFPGSFNPIHKGHISIIEKSSKLFDKVIIVVSFNNEKSAHNNFDENIKIIKQKILHIPNVKIIKNENMMTAELAKKLKIKYIVRSARDNLDYKYELELAAGNNSLNKEIETILIIPDYENIDYKSRLEKQKLSPIQ